MAFTRDTNDYNNVSALPDVVENQATNVKTTMDKAGNDQQIFMNNFLDALESAILGSDGALSIGVNATGVVATNVNAAIAELKAAIVDSQLGEIVDGSITEAKMAAEMKKQAGGVYPYDSGDTNATNISTNSTDISDLEDREGYTDTTGSINAYIVDTGNTFEYVDGKPLRINPNFTNTASATIAYDGTTKNIRKFDVDSDSFVTLDEGDIKKNNPVDLVVDATNDFFVLAPKSSGGISFLGASEYDTNTTASTPTTKISVTGAGWICGVNAPSFSGVNVSFNVDGTTDAIWLQNALPAQGSIFIMHRYETGFDLKADSTTWGAVAYLVDDGSGKVENASLKISSSTSATANTTVKSVTGAGWLYLVGSTTITRAITLDIDSVNVCTNLDVNGLPVIARFESGFVLKAETDWQVSYTLDS